MGRQVPFNISLGRQTNQWYGRLRVINQEYSRQSSQGQRQNIRPWSRNQAEEHDDGMRHVRECQNDGTDDKQWTCARQEAGQGGTGGINHTWVDQSKLWGQTTTVGGMHQGGSGKPSKRKQNTWNVTGYTHLNEYWKKKIEPIRHPNRKPRTITASLQHHSTSSFCGRKMKNNNRHFWQTMNSNP